MKYAVVGFRYSRLPCSEKIRKLDKEGCIDVYSNYRDGPL